MSEEIKEISEVKKQKPKKTKIELLEISLKIMLYLAIIAFIMLGIFAENIFGIDNIFTKNIGSVFKFWENLDDKLPSILLSISYLIAILVITKALRWLIKFFMTKVNKAKAVMNLLDSFIKYFSAIAAIFIVLGQLGVDTTALLASIGILGLAVGLGAQSLIEDIISGLFIVFEKTFDVGDIIVVNGFRGTVTEIGLRAIRVVDIGGDTKIINNSKVGEIINMTNQLSIAICCVEIEYNESIQRVENLLEEAFPIMRESIPAIVDGPFYKGLNKLNSSGVELKIVANCYEKNKFQVMRDINREIKLLFDKNNVSIPFPHLIVNPSSEPICISESDAIRANAFVKQQRELSKHLEDDLN